MRLFAPWLFVLPAFLLGASREDGSGTPSPCPVGFSEGKPNLAAREDIKITGTLSAPLKGQNLNRSVSGHQSSRWVD
jgi:hypothetical protein